MFPNFQNYFPPGMGKGSRPQRILWRSIWANYFPALIPFHFLCEGNNFTLLPTSLSTNMCDQRIILAEKNRTALNMILFHTGYTDWVTIRYWDKKRPKKSLARESSVLYPSPLLMKNSSQLHLHSGKKLMAFGYKWTGKKAFLFSLFFTLFGGSG